MGIREMTKTLSKGIVGLAIIAGAFFLFSGMAGAVTYTVTLAGDEVSDDPVYITPIKVTITPVGETEDTADAIINRFTLTSKSNFWGKERKLQCNVIARNRKIHLAGPDPLNPDPLNPDPLNPDPLNPDPLNPDPSDPSSSTPVWWYEPEAQAHITLWRIPVIDLYNENGEPAAYGEGVVSYSMPREGSDIEIMEEPSLTAKLSAGNSNLLYRTCQRQGMSEEDAYKFTNEICNLQAGVYDMLINDGVDPAVASVISREIAASAIDAKLNGKEEDGTRGYCYQTSDGHTIFVAYASDPESNGLLKVHAGVAEGNVTTESGEVVSLDSAEAEEVFETRKDSEKREVGSGTKLASIEDVRRLDYSLFQQQIQNPRQTYPSQYNVESAGVPISSESVNTAISSPVVQPLTAVTWPTNSSLIDRIGLPRNQQVVNPSLYSSTPEPFNLSAPPATPKYSIVPNQNNTSLRAISYQPPRSNWPPKW